MRGLARVYQPSGSSTEGTPQPLADPWSIAAATPEGRLALLASSRQGLSEAEAAARLRRFGPNQPLRQRATHPLQAFLSQFTHTLALLLWLAAGLAFAGNIPELGTAIVAIVVINGVFAYIQEYRAERVVAGLMQHVAVQTRVLRDGVMRSVPAPLLVPGDVVDLDAGDVVPADCVLLEGETLTLDLSLLTGETIPVERSADPVPTGGRKAFHAAEVANILPAGSGVVAGSALAAVWATGSASSVGQIAGLTEAEDTRASLLERQVRQLSRTTAVIAVVAGTATLALATLVRETTFTDALTFSTGIIVALVPEGLLPILSVSLAIGAERMARRGIAVRRLSAIEVVGSVTVICTDKTGTLTQNRLVVGECIAPVLDELLVAAVLCNDAQDEGGTFDGDPIDVALLVFADARGRQPQAIRQMYPRLAVEPFDARRRYMSVTCLVEGNPRRFVKGAPESVLALTNEDAMPVDLEAGLQAATSRGERVLLFASGPGGGSLRLTGLISFRDPTREGVEAAMASCKSAGIRVVMLTGDHRETARFVAHSVGLTDAEERMIEGRDLDALTDGELAEFLARDAVIARVDPIQKLRVVNVLTAAGEIVVVTGDGINDAPALKAADMGIAMGLRGAEVAKQAADVVIADDNFATIVAAIEEGRSIKANIRRFISYVFTSNVAEMTPFLLYIFLPVPLPLAVIQALAIDIGTDLLPALALGTEQPSSRTMSVPPESPPTPLLTREVGLRTFLFFGVLEAALGLVGFFAYYLDAGWRLESFAPYESIAREAATITFLSIVGGQVGCLFAQRDGPLRRRLSLVSNRWILTGLVFELVVALSLVYTPGLNGLFSMTAVEPAWLLVLPVSAAVFTMADLARRAVFLRRL